MGRVVEEDGAGGAIEDAEGLLVGVDHLGGAVPLEGLAGAQCDVAEQARFGEQAGMGDEVAT